MAIQMTRAEYEAKYGAKPAVAAQAPVQMTRAEYEAKYGQPEKAATATGELFDYVRASTRLKSGEIKNMQSEKDEVVKGVSQMEQMKKIKPQDTAYLNQKIKESRNRIAEIDKTVKDVTFKADKTLGQKAGIALGTGLEIGTLPEIGLLGAAGVTAGLGKAGIKTSPALAKSVYEVAPKNKVVQGINKALAPTVTKGYDAMSLANKGKVIAKDTAKMLPESVGYGYAFDVAQGARDGEGAEALTPGVGTALGVGLPVAIGGARFAKNAIIPSSTQKLEKIRTAREKELFDIENNYAKLRKGMNLSKDQNAEVRKRVAKADIWEGAVDTEGTVRTTTKGGVVDRYKAMTIDGGEGVVRQNLEREGAYTTLDKVKAKLEKTILDGRLPIDEKETALSNVDKIIAGFNRAYPDGKVPLVALQDEKTRAYAAIDYTNPTSKIKQKDIARGYKELVEETSNVNVKQQNDELAKYYKDIELLENLDGRKVKGGKLGKYFAQISGNIIGGATGGAVGGPVGVAVGTVIGGEAASFLKGAALSKTLKSGGEVAPKSPILEKAKETGSSPRLALPAPKFGRDYIPQSNNAGSLNTQYSNTNIPKTTVIPNSLPRANNAVKKGSVDSTKKPNGAAFAGAPAGIEQDENGEYKVDPMKMALGMAVGGFAGKVGKKMAPVEINRIVSKMDGEDYLILKKYNQGGSIDDEIKARNLLEQMKVNIERNNMSLKKEVARILDGFEGRIK
jgi:hypothetical protein